MGVFERGLAALPAYKSLCGDIRAGRLPAGLTGLGHIHKVLMIHALAATLGRRSLLLVADEAEATRVCEDLEALGNRPLFLPARDLSLRRVESTSREYEQMRLGVLSRMAAEDFDCVVACVDAAAQYTLPPETLLSHTLRLTAGGPLPVKDLAVALAAAGYERCDQIEGPGQFAVRGGILDVYPADCPAPVRIELWGDAVDTLSYFDLLSQRRTESLETISVPPAAEIMYDDPDTLAEKIGALAAGLRGKNAAAAKENLLADAERLRGGGQPASFDRYIPLIYEKPATLFDYADGALFFVSEMAKVRERLRTSQWQLQEDIKTLLAEGQLCRGLTDYAMDEAGVLAELERRGAVLFDTFAPVSYTHLFRAITRITSSAVRTTATTDQITIIRTAPFLSMDISFLSGLARGRLSGFLCYCFRRRNTARRICCSAMATRKRIQETGQALQRKLIRR